MQDIVISIDEMGDMRFLVGELGAGFMPGDATIRRASHVEPVSPMLRAVFHTLRYMFGEKGKIAAFTRLWPCLWRINLSPVSGPILPDTYRNRQAAIDAEILWL